MDLRLNKRLLVQICPPHQSRRQTACFFLPLISAAIAGRDDSGLKNIIHFALSKGIPKKSIYEIILQSHLFLGFPAMIEAARLFAGITNPKYKRNRFPEPYNSKTVKKWNRDGMDKIRRLYGESFDRLVPYINSFSPQILTWMINDGYGQVLSRPGVAFDVRELSVIATLTVTMYKNQLRAHLRGALNIGVAMEDVEAVIDHCRFFCIKKNIQTSRKILKEVIWEINA
ncbi:MAG: hypothetical protein ABIE07_08540 [Candidatus Zixiibacteriota bacterium]